MGFIIIALIILYMVLMGNSLGSYQFWISVGLIAICVGICFIGSVTREVSYQVSAPYIAIHNNTDRSGGSIATPSYELNYITSNKIVINLSITRDNTMIDESIKKPFVSYTIWESYIPFWTFVHHWTWAESAVLPRDAFKRQDGVITKSLGGVQIR